MGADLHKADFGEIYNEPDARAYYRTLGQYDYRIPEHGAAMFRRLLQPQAQHAPGDRELRAPKTVLDVCCSYGVLAGLLKTDLSIDDLYRHYQDPGMDGLSVEDAAEVDRKYIAEHAIADQPRMLGLDIAGNAVSYAESAGLLDTGFVENLESDEPSNRLRAVMSDVDLIITTGGIGYVTDTTFARLLAAAKPTVWVASFCLRAYDYAPIRRVLDSHGLHTEQAARTFEQRRFVDADEQRWSIDQVREWGLDPAGREDDGYYHANFYLSRPADEARRLPAGELIPDVFA